jgi:RimJ/RimL family protein N-acetyltransferase
VLHGKTVRLRAIERSDIPAFVLWLNDPERRRGLLVTDPMSHAREEVWFERQLASEDRVLAIEVETDSGWTHVGNVALVKVNWKDRTGSVAIMIGEKAHEGRGLAADAMRTLVRHAFGELNLHRLELEVFDFNERAIRCYERCGFRREGTKREALFRDGRYWDVHVMGLLATDSQARGQLDPA